LAAASISNSPNGSRAIDSFIDWPSMLGRGHGQAYSRLLAERLCAEGAPLAAIDPAEGNLRAQRAYEKAGFLVEARVMTEADPAALMLYEPSATSGLLSWSQSWPNWRARPQAII
jgi:aminoglycoside 6'-N-acetyltransferase